MRFVWHTLFAAAANLFLLSAIFYFLFSGSDELPVFEDEPDKEALFTQERLFLTKDLLYAGSAGERMQMRVRGKRASLIIAKDGKGHQLKEKMSGIKGYFQEKFFYQNEAPMQNLDCFEAAVAEYDNQTGQISASEVKLFKLVLPGHGLVENAKSGRRVAEGTCEELHFSLKEKQIQVVAEGFHGQFQGGKKT